MMNAANLAAHLGLRRYPRSWRGRCPCCDYANGTFAVQEDKGGRVRLYCANGCDRGQLEKAVAAAIGQKAVVAQTSDATSARELNRERALALWRGSEPALGTLADCYLSARGLAGIAASPALRFRADCSHPEGGRHPALIALVSDYSGAPLAVHRTFLTRDGRKAAVEPPKASLGPVWGGAIRLSATEPDKPFVIGEGIETAASAGLLMGLPAWAALSAGNLAKGLRLPPDARSVTIAADPDDAGRTAARDAWTRWTGEGRAVRIATPNGRGDFNDLIREEVRHVG